MMIYTLPIIAAFTGWLTNFIAVKMLFHPRKERRILFLKIQGVFPKRQKKLAEKLGQIVSTELFSIDDIRKNLDNDATHQEIHRVVGERIDAFLNVRLVNALPMLKMFLNDKVKEQIKTILFEEFEGIIPEITNKYVDKIEKSVDVEKIVYDKVANFSSEKLEQILFSIMRKEFKFIELLGGILGFIIGLIQIALLKLQ